MFSKNEKDSLYEHDCALDKVYDKIAETSASLQKISDNTEIKSYELIDAIECLNKAKGYLAATQHKLSQIY